MGRTAHCPCRKRALPSFPLGDANRGVFGRLAGSNRESPPHRPPERRAFSFPDVPGRARRAGPGFWPVGPRLRTIPAPSADPRPALDRSRARPRRGRRSAPACDSPPWRGRAAGTPRPRPDCAGVRERQPRRRRAGAEPGGRGCRADASRRARRALRRRIHRPDLRLRRRPHGVRLSRPLRGRGRRLVARAAARSRERAFGNRERGLRGDRDDRLRRRELCGSSVRGSPPPSGRRAPRSSRCSWRSA